MMGTDIKGIGLMPLNRCNASCSHCGSDSGPQKRSELSINLIKSVIEQAGILYGEGWCLALSGGEVFIDTYKLNNYIKLAKKNGGFATAVTNGFWADSYERAANIISEIIDNGLKFLAVSTDNFHAPYVKYKNIKNIIKAATDLRLPIEIRVTSSHAFRLRDAVKRTESSHPWFIRYVEMPLVPYGRATLINKSLLIMSDDTPKGTCPAPSLTINHDGNAMFCCNGGGYSSHLSLGNIKTSSLAEIQNKFDNHVLGNFLRNCGPIALLDTIKSMHPSHIVDKYVDECHLCIEMLSSKLLDIANVPNISTHYAIHQAR